MIPVYTCPFLYRSSRSFINFLCLFCSIDFIRSFNSYYSTVVPAIPCFSPSNYVDLREGSCCPNDYTFFPAHGQYDTNINMHCNVFLARGYIGTTNASCCGFWMIFWSVNTNCYYRGARKCYLVEMYCYKYDMTCWSINTHYCPSGDILICQFIMLQWNMDILFRQNKCLVT